MRTKKLMHDIEWEHMVTRRLAVQVAIAWNYGFGVLFNKRYRTGINNTVVYYDGKKTDYFVDQKEHSQYNDDLDNLLDNPEIVFSLIPEAKEFVEETYDLIKRMIKGAENHSDSSLADLYNRFSYHHMNYYTRMWMVFRICERIIRKIESKLKQKIKDENKVKELTRVFSIPLKPNDVTNERMDLLRIALMKDKIGQEELRRHLEAHKEQYQHIPMFDFDHEPYTKEHFKNELEQIEEAETELINTEKTFSEREEHYETMLAKLNPGPELEALINMLKKAVYVRDYRDMIRQKLNLAIRKLYQEIGSRIGLSVKETALLTNSEIEDHLKSSKAFSRAEINRRKRSFLLVQIGDKIDIYSEKEAERKAEELALYKKAKDTDIIKGRAASPGIKKGIARIIHTNLDFDKLRKGEIMVAGMTRQDFVPVMRRASAIVTNEGGVTCHAAIIARELRLPCVVGTDQATEIIKDGDIIEVNADKGIIRKINQEKVDSVKN